MTSLPEGGLEQVHIDMLLLADWAEAINGKLYIQGGGWERRVVAPGQMAAFSVAASIVIPWNFTNQQHEFTVSIEDEDGSRVLSSLTGNTTVGRPPDARPGQNFRVAMAVQFAGLQLEPGDYRVVMSVNGEASRSASFAAVGKK